ncbi:uncharacterized protein [Rutidosis leptorrhynchoides]|uniref:uncharacterized protein n=1 Tax=Rutidosis leptorrhynchoides TaxID=125765 RepID=UPI003A998855
MSVNATTAIDDVVIGMFLINSINARVLFDSGVNKSFMSLNFCDKLILSTTMLLDLLRVEVADGKTVLVTTSISEATIKIDRSLFSMTCLLLAITSFDVVLGMDWLSLHRASIKYHKKIIAFPLTNGNRAVARGERADKKTIADIPVVSEFPEIFPEEFPDLPPVREVEYKIELVQGTTLVVKALY